MDPRDRDAITNLFTKLRDVERQAGPRDAEAAGLIQDEIGRNPGAAYYMAQTIVMQDMALNRLNADMETLRREVDEMRRQDAPAPSRPAEGGFLSRILGGGAAASQAPAPSRATAGPWGGQPAQPAYPGAQTAAPPSQYAQPGYGQPQPGYGQPQGGGFGRGMGGGGFLAGAAQTAMGVAGGVVLGNAIGSMFGGHGGLFGGEGTPEIQETVNNVFEAPQDAAPQDVADQGGSDDGGYQDASYDDGGGWDDSQDI